MINKTFNPSISSGVTNYIYDPDSGNTTQPPANGAWNTVSRWQGPTPGTLTQTQSNYFTSSINTESLPFRTVSGGGPHNVLAYTNPGNINQRPFGDYVDLSWGQSIDYFYSATDGVAQLNAYVYLRDPNGNFIAIVFAAYDNRYATYPPFVGNDGSTFFISTPIGNTIYCSSDNSMAYPGSGFTNYSLRFTKQHLATALANLAAQGATTPWMCPADWVIHEVGIIHEVFQFNDPANQLQSTVQFSSVNVVNTTLDYPATINFSQGYPLFSTILPGIQTTPDAYSIQETVAGGYNVGAGIQTLKFTWRSHRYFELNAGGHFAMILRANDNALRESTRHLQGTGLLFGNLTGYVNPDTGHVGNPLTPSTIVETWYGGLHTYGNDLIPGTWGTALLQDDVTYEVEVKAIIDNTGKSLVSYKITSAGITLFDFPPVADNNTYYDPTQTGIIMGQVFGGGVAGWDISITNLSITWTALTSTYIITPDKTTVNEGERVTWTITTTNVADGTILYWTNAGTTDGYDFSDFVVGPSTGNDGGVTITGNSGSFYKTLANDLITEGAETIIIQLRTGSIYGSIVATAATVTVNDTSTAPTTPTYSIAPDKTTVNEGEMVTWNVATTNVPDTTLYWVNTGTTVGADFSDTVIGPSDGLSGPVTITSGAGSFTRTLANDLITEGPETIKMNLRTGSSTGPMVAKASTVTVVDSSITPPAGTPTYIIQPAGLIAGATINEGSTVVYNIITSNVSTGTTLYWFNAGTTTGPDFTDYNPGIADSGMAGSITINSSGNASFFRTLSNDNLLEGSETIVMQLRTVSDRLVSPVAISDTIYVNDTSVPGAKTYTIIPRKTSYDEGETAYFDISTSNVPDGTILYFTGAVGTGFITEDDFSTDGSQWRNYGPVTILNGAGVIYRPFKLDLVTEGAEYWKVQLRTDSINGPIVAISDPIRINDVSTGLPYYEITPDTTLVKEGGIVTYTVTAYNVPLNSVIYWTTDGLNSTVSAEDFVDRAMSGFTIIGTATSNPSINIGKFKRILIKDHLSEGAETIIIRVRRGSINGPIEATSVPVQVKDTSRTPVVKWVNTGSLGTLVPGQISELYVKALFNTSTIYPKYVLSEGVLPPGLVLERDGTISGQVAVNVNYAFAFVSTNTFTVSVNDSNNNNRLNGEFSITVVQSTNTDYTGVFCKPLLSQSKRTEFNNLIRNESIFVPNMLYRPMDPNFGIQADMRIFIDFGVEKLSLHEYADILSKNFYKRPFSLGNIKTAVAKNADGTVKYEFIYVDIIDKHVNSNNVSVPTQITFNGVTYYPPSIPNMRSRFTAGSDMTTVRNPSFTKFIQSGDSVPLGYIPFLPLCFTLPGKSATIIRKIAENGFKFNTFSIEIDRVVFLDSTGENGAKYLLLSRSSKLA